MNAFPRKIFNKIIYFNMFLDVALCWKRSLRELGWQFTAGSKISRAKIICFQHRAFSSLLEALHSGDAIDPRWAGTYWLNLCAKKLNRRVKIYEVRLRICSNLAYDALIKMKNVWGWCNVINWKFTDSKFYVESQKYV